MSHHAPAPTLGRPWPSEGVRALARTVTTIQMRLEMYYEAERKILAGAQSYAIGNRQLTRANLGEIRKTISELEDELESLIGKSRGISRRVVFMD